MLLVVPLALVGMLALLLASLVLVGPGLGSNFFVSVLELLLLVRPLDVE